METTTQYSLFDRTRAALAAYEAADAAFDEHADAESLAALDAAEKAIGEAFADDTATINRREDALTMPSCGHEWAWLRWTLENY